MKPILITTTNTIEGQRILEYKGIVTANIVTGTGVFSDLAASFTDFFGGRSGTYKRQMSTIYDEAIEELSNKTIQKGGNAILGFKINIDNISAKGMSMFMISVTGTAAIIQENKSTGHVEEREGAITATALKNEINKRHIEYVLKNKKILSISDWELVLQNPSEAYSTALCESALYFVNSLPDADPKKYFSRLGEYLANIDRSTAIKSIYSIVPSVPEYAIRIIIEKELFDATSIKNLIKEGKLSIACSTILSSNQATYAKDDLIEMEEILSLFDNLPDVGKITTVKGLLSKEKERYVCQYGHYNQKDAEFCQMCGENIKGLRSEQVKQIEDFRQKVESLRFLFQ